MYKLLSERMKDKDNQPEVYEYDRFPEKFRNQLFWIIKKVFDDYSNVDMNAWDIIHDDFSQKLGRKSLGKYIAEGSNYGRPNIETFISESGDSDLLDFIDFVFNKMDVVLQNDYSEYSWQIRKATDELIDDSINELNEYFQQNNLGYEFINKQIVRIDNKLLHQEAIKPALRLLYEEEFEGAEEEFRRAFDFKRKKDNKNAILEAGRAFESTIKTICEKNKYPFDKKDTAKQLINTLENNHFYPEYMNTYFAQLTSLMATGLPVIRNKEAGHGQGSEVREIPDELAEYAINLAAANIVMLVGIYKRTRKV